MAWLATVKPWIYEIHKWLALLYSSNDLKLLDLFRCLGLGVAELFEQPSVIYRFIRQPLTPGNVALFPYSVQKRVLLHVYGFKPSNEDGVLDMWIQQTIVGALEMLSELVNCSRICVIQPDHRNPSGDLWISDYSNSFVNTVYSEVSAVMDGLVAEVSI